MSNRKLQDFNTIKVFIVEILLFACHMCKHKIMPFTVTKSDQTIEKNAENIQENGNSTAITNISGKLCSILSVTDSY